MLLGVYSSVRDVQADDSVPTIPVFAIRGPITRDDLPGLCARVCGVLSDSPAAVVACQVPGVAPDAVAVDALARLQLAARRHGCRVVLVGASPELIELVALMGLADVLTQDAGEARSAETAAPYRGRR